MYRLEVFKGKYAQLEGKPLEPIEGRPDRRKFIFAIIAVIILLLVGGWLAFTANDSDNDEQENVADVPISQTSEVQEEEISGIVYGFGIGFETTADIFFQRNKRGIRTLVTKEPYRNW